MTASVLHVGADVATETGPGTGATATTRRSLRAVLLGWTGSVRGGPLFWLSTVVLLLTVVVAVLAPLLAPQDPDALDLGAALAGPSRAHLLGADQSGRDLLSRLIFGTRTSLIGPLGVVVLSTVGGVVIGLVAAWCGGWVDACLSRVVELIFAFPGLLLAIIVVAVVGPGVWAPMLAMAVAYTPYVSRLVRSVVLQEMSRPYVDAYRVQGFSGVLIATRHVLPNALPVVLAQSTVNFGYALMDLAALSYLGLGVQPPMADWGAMISSGQTAILQESYLPSLVPGVAIVVVVVAFNIVGEGLSARIVRRSP